MANEFKVNPRQHTSPQTDLPSTNVYGRLSAALGDISNTFGQIATGITVEEQALEGAKARQEGPREKLAPGLTKATQAFNKSFEQMDASLVTMDVSSSLAADYAEAVKPENLAQPGNVERYQRISRAKIEGALQSALATNRPEIALNLTKLTANNALKIADAQNTFDFKRAVSQASVANTERIEAIYNDEVEGSPEQANENYEQLNTDVATQESLGMIDAKEAHQFKEIAKQTRINGNLERVFKEQATEEDRARFLYNLANSHDSLTLSPTERQAAVTHIGKVNATMVKSQSAAANIGFDRIEQTLSFRPEEFPSIESLRSAYVKSAQDGYPLTTAQIMTLDNQYLKAQAKDNQVKIRNAEINNIIKTPAAGDLTSNELTGWFTDKVEEYKERNAAIINSNLPARQKLLEQAADWQIEAAVAAQSKYIPIPAYTERLTNKLYGGSIEEKLGVVSAFSYLQTANPRALDGMNATDRALVESIVSRMQANTGVAPEEIIRQSFDSIVNVTKDVKDKREQQLRSFKKDNPSYYDKLVSDIYGGNLDGMLGETQTVMRNAVEKEFDTYYLLSGNDKAAAKITKQNMAYKAAKSKFGSPGVPMWNPVENLPFYGLMGNSVENQFTRNLQSLVRTSEKNPEEGAPTIRWSSKMGKAPSAWSENDKVLGNYTPNGWWLNIDGKDRRVYLVSPTLNQTKQAGINQPLYSIYYDNDGIPTPLMSLQSQAVSETEATWRIGTTFMQFVPPERDVPKAWEAFQKDENDLGIAEAVEAKIAQENKKIPLPSNLIGSGFEYPQEELPLSSKQKDKLKKYAEESKKETKAKFDEARMKKLESKLEGETSSD